jgi:hypothetical protein
MFESRADGVYLVSKDCEIEFMNRVLREAFGDHVSDICYKAFHGREDPLSTVQTFRGDKRKDAAVGMAFSQDRQDF